MNTFASRALLFAVLGCTGSVVLAQSDPAPAAPATPAAPAMPAAQALPELSPGAPSSADEPVITIRRQEGSELKEYRVRGQLIAVKVTPQVGKPYWLINRKGEMQRHDGPSPNLTVPSWLVLEW